MKRKSRSSILEIAALASFAMGFALYVAVDTGVLKLGFSRTPQSVSATDTAVAEFQQSEASSARVARLKNLYGKIDFVEGKMREKVSALKKMHEEIEGIEKRLAVERQGLSQVSTMVFEIEKGREALSRESGVLSLGAPGALPAALARISKAVGDIGVDASRISSVVWKDHTYVRMVDPFEFKDESIYMLMRGLDKADRLADVIEKDGLRDVTVVFRDPDSGGSEIVRERAFVLRNYLRDVLEEDFKIKISKVNSAIVAPGSVEIWVGQ